MTQPTTATGFYGDFTALSALKRDARADQPQALRKAAQQFESLFTEMMLKSMRSASFGDALTGSQEVDFYQGMFDQQLSLQLSKGKGMGLADMLVQQLARTGLDTQTAQPTAVATTAPVQTATHQAAVVQSTPVVSSASVSTPSSLLSAETPSEFVRCVWPHAQQAAQRLGVDPAMLVAHAALETGWGKHVPTNQDGSSSLNLFGIKAGRSWQGEHAANSTLEYVNGQPVEQLANFKSYSSMADCFADYAQVLGQQPRYQGLLNAGNNANQFASGLQRGGYATDPHYSDKLQSVMRSVTSLIPQMRS